MVTNISAYRFAPLNGLKSLRAALMEACQQGGLKGTILLSTEGINLFVAGFLPALLHVARGNAEAVVGGPSRPATAGD